MVKEKTRIIAYYLPQFHTIPENDKWWGKGFTEWTNVGQSKPLFRGHYQPRVPADLGYYDLRMPEIREAQVELAKEAGVYGFCYWHYWFGDGKMLLEKPFQEVLESGKPDFPFSLGWANESWKAKQWKDGEGDKLLIEQTYSGIEDYKSHFDYALEAFKDSRYITVNDSPMFLIYKPEYLPDDFIPLWNKWAKENGFKNGIHFIGRLLDFRQKQKLEKKGFNAFTIERQSGFYHVKRNFGKLLFRLKGIISKRPTFTIEYKDAIKNFSNKKIDSAEDIYPSIIPNWDHSPRSGKRASILHGSTPSLFQAHAEEVLEIVNNKANKIIFLKSWNEWAEGNYMEPDIVFGRGYIKALKAAINKIAR